MLSSYGLTANAAPEPGEAWQQLNISWRVENPFRFFRDPADTEVHRATYWALNAEEQLHPILSAERQLAMRHSDGWALSMFKKTCWSAKAQRHACPTRSAYLKPKQHTILTTLRGPAKSDAVCTWFAAPRRPKMAPAVLTAPCSNPVALKLPYPEGSDVSVVVNGAVVARKYIAVEDIFVVGIGDSFASGEGNPDQPVRFSRERSVDYGRADRALSLSGYPTRVGQWQHIGDKAFLKEGARWLGQACHRSLYAYQLRVALQLAVENPHRAVTYAGFACAGSEIVRGLFLRYKGNEWVPVPPDLPQVSAAADAQCGSQATRKMVLTDAYHIGGRVPELASVELRKCARKHARPIDLLLVSIGGNDVGFSRLVANAVLSDASMLRKLGGWIGRVHGGEEAAQYLGLLAARFKALNRAVHYILNIPWPQADRVILTAYPRMALLQDGHSVCPDTRAGMRVLSEFALSTSKARDSEAVSERLHRAMQRAATTHGWTFAARHRYEFAGHSICAGRSDSLAGLANDLRLPRKLNDLWVPFNPADFRPYASRTRWFRTPNDAYLTGHFHVSTKLIQSVLKRETLNWFQLLLASTYSGAFHPTAEGQAAIADATLFKARSVLERYARSNGRTTD